MPKTPILCCISRAEEEQTNTSYTKYSNLLKLLTKAFGAVVASNI